MTDLALNALAIAFAICMVISTWSIFRALPTIYHLQRGRTRCGACDGRGRRESVETNRYDTAGESCGPRYTQVACDLCAGTGWRRIEEIPKIETEKPQRAFPLLPVFGHKTMDQFNDTIRESKDFS